MTKKPQIPFLILAVCALAVFFGLRGVLRSGNAATSSGVPGAAPEAHTAPGTRHYDSLDDVRIPASIPSQIKDYTGFRLSFNADNHTPNWVAWELLASETDGAEKRSHRFWQDEDISGCPATADYARSGYDRGHLCPAADQKWLPAAMSDCFVMANICPQDHSLNSGAWNTLENKERTWAARDSAIVIVAGPIYGNSDRKTIGESRVRVPGAFFKCIIAPYLDEPRGIAFIFPNMSAPGSMQQYAVTIDEVERITGFDFFHSLPDDIEKKVESSASFQLWNRKR